MSWGNLAPCGTLTNLRAAEWRNIKAKYDRFMLKRCVYCGIPRKKSKGKIEKSFAKCSVV